MGIIFNEDPNHFVHSAVLAGCTTVTEEMIRDYIRLFAGTNVTDFFVCVNASMPYYPSQKQPSVIDRYTSWEGTDWQTHYATPEIALDGKLLRDLRDKGINVFSVWLDEIRKCGMRGWISVRMNDIHEMENCANAFLPSDLLVTPAKEFCS